MAHAQVKYLFSTPDSVAGLMRLEPGAHEARHVDLGGQHHIWVLDGAVQFGGRRLEAGSYLHVPDGMSHSLQTHPQGCTLLFTYLRQEHTAQENGHAVPGEHAAVELIATSNMRLLLPQQRSIAPEATPCPNGITSSPETLGWTIRDRDGNTVGSVLSNRSEALRAIGSVTFRCASLPLTVHGPDGQPTGDRLA